MADYGFVHDGRVFTPNGTPDITPAENAERNQAIEAAQLAEWRMRPDRFIAYYKIDGANLNARYYGVTCGIVTTWLGTVLGTITSYATYRHNFGGRFISLRVKGTNGAEYYGRASWDNGSIIRLRRAR